ncbi:MAG TPA: cbb3-type cytochrome oxidase assembly protein CcoS [bacterium]
MGLDVLYLLIPASVLLALVALALFVWAIHSGQFDDLETPAIRILFDDVPVPNPDIAARPALAEARATHAETPSRASE